MPCQASQPSTRNPLVTISSLLSTAVGTTSTGIPRLQSQRVLTSPGGARTLPSPSLQSQGATRLSPSCTHYRWMRETVVLKAAWMSATEQVDTTNCLCAWSCSLTYCQCRELGLRHPRGAWLYWPAPAHACPGPCGPWNTTGAAVSTHAVPSALKPSGHPWLHA